MVSPSWDNFQRPNQQESLNEQPQSSELIEPMKEYAQELPGAIEDVKKPEAEKPEWGNFQSPSTYQGPIDETAEENIFGYLTRNIASNASRLGEQVIGSGGNIEKMGKDILSNYPAAGGVLSYGLAKLMGQERWDRLLGKNDQMLPTSENIKELSQKSTKGYTKPKTAGEEKFQGYTEDIGSTLTGRPFNTLKKIAVNNLAIPVASNFVKNTVADLGFGEGKSNLAKVATWISLSLLGNVNAPKYASELTNKGRNDIPNNVNINVPRFEKRLQKVANDPNLLHADPRTSLARQELANIQRDLENGQVSTKSLMTTYDGVNAAKRDAGLFSMNSSDQKFARRAIDKVREAVRDEILESGANFPDAIQSWKDGMGAWAVIHQSNAITNWVDSLARGKYSKILSGPAAALFGVSAYGGLQSPLVSVPGSVAGAGIYKAAQTGYRVWNNPKLAKYYWNAIDEAQRQNTPAFINNYNKLNKELEKSDSTKKKTKTKKN